MINKIIFCALIFTAASLNSFATTEGGQTGGGGTNDQTCYFVASDRNLTLNEVSREKICTDTNEMVNACLDLTNTENCTGVPAASLKMALKRTQ